MASRTLLAACTPMKRAVGARELEKAMLRPATRQVARPFRVDRTLLQTSRRRSHTKSSVAPPPNPIETPTREQLRNHFVMSMVPMIGFGFMDNTIMIQAGNAIDCTLGVTLGMSTLSAAAVGQIVSGGGSVLFGGTLESMFRAAGLPSAGFSSAQRALPAVQKVGMLGNFVGVVIGCTLGLVNLLFIDTERSSVLKLQALTDEQGFAFEVEANNVERHDATTLRVRGPDVDGLLASMTSALTASGCSLVELHASPRAGGCSGSGCPVEDVFIVRRRGTGVNRQVDDDDLDELAHALLAATKDPLSAHSLKTQVQNLSEENDNLADHIKTLEKELEDRQITIVPRQMTHRTGVPVQFTDQKVQFGENEKAFETAALK